MTWLQYKDPYRRFFASFVGSRKLRPVWARSALTLALWPPRWTPCSYPESGPAGKLIWQRNPRKFRRWRWEHRASQRPSLRARPVVIFGSPSLRQASLCWFRLFGGLNCPFWVRGKECSDLYDECGEKGILISDDMTTSIYNKKERYGGNWNRYRNPKKSKTKSRNIPASLKRHVLSYCSVLMLAIYYFALITHHERWNPSWL